MANRADLRGLRVHLDLQQCEDRVTPASPGMDPYRVLVQAPADLAESAVVREIRQVRGTAGVESLGLGLYRVQLGPGLTMEGAKLQLAQLPSIRHIQPDYKLQLTSLPGDPRVSEQWAYNNVGQGGGAVGADIAAARAWTVSTGTRQTIVAVIDTGVDYRHPDLAQNIWVNPREIPGNGRDDDGNGFVDDIHGVDFMNNTGNPMDDYRHGTHIAGIIGAVGDNGIGVSGVNWNTRIMPLRFMSASGGGFTSDAVRAINYAVANGAKIINNSWGGAPYDAALVTAISNARNAGVIVVNAAGNTGVNTDSSPFYPGSYSTILDNVVTVAATDRRDQLISYSNVGQNSVTIAAPGDNILSTFPNNSYNYLSGTSMATPFVTGALSLLWDANPTWSYQQVIAKLKSSVDVLPALAGKVSTGGRLNLAKLLDAPAVAPVPPVVPPPASPPATTTNASTLRVNSASFSGPRSGTLDRVRIAFSHSVSTTALRSALTLTGPRGPIGISAVLPIAGTNNTQFNLMFSGAQTTAGSYQLVVASGLTDLAGNRLNQNGNGVTGEAADRFVVSTSLGTVSTPTVPPAPAPTPAPTAPSQARLNVSLIGGARTILDRRTTRVEFLVTEDVRISDVTLSLDITHGRTSDLNMRLVAPDGRMITLFNRRGGTGANLSGTTFDSSASVGLAQASAPFRGSLRPEQSLASLAGMSAKGVWTLQIFDLASGMTGSLTSARLSLGVASSPTSFDSTGVRLAPELEAVRNDGRADQLSTLA